MIERALTSAGRTTRDEILLASIDMFAECGYAGTSMRALGRAVGMKESALYHYFDSKERLFYAMIESVLQRRAEKLQAETGTIGRMPLRRLLTRLTRLFISQLETPLERKFWRIVMAEGPRLEGCREMLSTLIVRHRQSALSFVEQLRTSGLIRKDISPEMFMLHFAAPIILHTNAPMGGGKGPLAMKRETFIKGHVGFLLHAVAP